MSKTYNYEIAISGSGGFQIFFDISKAAYEYYCDDDELLTNHVFEGEEVPEEFSIGGWDDLSEAADGIGYELGDCSLSIDSIDGIDEAYSFYKYKGLNDSDLKDLGVKLIREKQTTMDELVNPGELKYFFLGIEAHKGTWNYELKTREPFDPRKLEMTACEIEESREIITSVCYDCDDKGEEFEFTGADSNYEVFLEVVKVDKTQTAGKLKKGCQEIRYFEFKDAHSSKFWELSVAGSTVTARYGKIGTNGQTSVKELDSPEQAQEHATKQAAGKLKKGYQEIRYFEFKDAHSSKFWEVSVNYSIVIVRYGKLGTNGQTSVKELDSPEQAQEHATKQAAGKLKKGYQEIEYV